MSDHLDDEMRNMNIEESENKDKGKEIKCKYKNIGIIIYK